jgi:hypothetical protein
MFRAQVPAAQLQAARDTAAMLQRELECSVPRAALQVPESEPARALPLLAHTQGPLLADR